MAGCQQSFPSQKLTWKPKKSPMKTTVPLKRGYMGFHVSSGECMVPFLGGILFMRRHIAQEARKDHTVEHPQTALRRHLNPKPPNLNPKPLNPKPPKPSTLESKLMSDKRLACVASHLLIKISSEGFAALLEAGPSQLSRGFWSPQLEGPHRKAWG